MKRLILITGLLVSCLASQVGAQTRGTGWFADSHGKTRQPYTTPNYDTTGVSVKSQILQVSGFYDDLIIQVNVKRLTGTPSAGLSVHLYGGIDGVNFPFEIKAAANDTLAVTGTAPQNHLWDVGQSHFTYYKLMYTPFGTHTAQLSGQFLWSKFLRTL